MADFVAALGREVWLDLHTIGCFERTTAVGQQYLALLCKHYPCAKCRENLNQCDVDKCDDNARFFWRLHNAVNGDLGKAFFPWCQMCQYTEYTLSERYDEIKAYGHAPEDYVRRLLALAAKHTMKLNVVYQRRASQER